MEVKKLDFCKVPMRQEKNQDRNTFRDGKCVLSSCSVMVKLRELPQFSCIAEGPFLKNGPGLQLSLRVQTFPGWLFRIRMARWQAAGLQSSPFFALAFVVGPLPCGDPWRPAQKREKDSGILQLDADEYTMVLGISPPLKHLSQIVQKRFSCGVEL